MSSWATRCNACGTSFRVSEDQLKISDGYVRCGRCDAVFNARSTLFDLDAPASAPAPLADLAASAAARTQQIEPAFEPGEPALDTQSEDSAFPPTAVPDEPMPTPDEVATEPGWDEPLQTLADRTEPSWGDDASSVNVVPAADATTRMRELLEAETTSLGELHVSTPTPASESPHVWPSLSRDALKASASAAPRQRRWTALGLLLAALLAFALPLQWAWIEREALRARVPELDALLQRHWPTLPSSGWRQLDGLSVASSSLQATPQGRAYQLELLLHNRAQHRIALPWLDLSLSDATGKLLLRRAIPPAELGKGTQMQAGEQRRLSLVFRVDAEQPVAGYELGLFHP